MPEGVQSCFELSIHFPVFFSRELFLVAVHSWFAIQTNVWKAMFFENYLTSDFHTNTVISRRVCLLVKMASKTVIRPIVVYTDQHPISPNKTTTLSTIQIMGIKRMITKRRNVLLCMNNSSQRVQKKQVHSYN